MSDMKKDFVAFNDEYELEDKRLYQVHLKSGIKKYVIYREPEIIDTCIHYVPSDPNFFKLGSEKHVIDKNEICEICKISNDKEK